MMSNYDTEASTQAKRLYSAALWILRLENEAPGLLTHDDVKTIEACKSLKVLLENGNGCLGVGQPSKEQLKLF